MEDFESRLTRELHELVDGEDPPPELRDRITEGLGLSGTARAVRRRWLPAAAAALLVIAGIGALVEVSGDDDGGSIDVATSPDDDPETGSTTTEDPDRLDDETTTTPSTTTPSTTAPATTATTEATTTTADDTPATSKPVPSSTTVPATNPPAPTTTALVCENSTDPACGDFHWSPQPTNQGASLTIEAPDVIFVDEPTELTLAMSDPDGPVTFDCYAVNLDRPGTSTGACSVTRQECPERYGPWSPPPPRPDQATTETSVVFQETGTYVISVDVDPPAGCDNVDPYRSGATATLTVEVVRPRI